MGKFLGFILIIIGLALSYIALFTSFASKQMFPFIRQAYLLIAGIVLILIGLYKFGTRPRV